MLAKVPLLTAKVMRDDSHTPPKDWDYSKGSWVCPQGGCEVSFKSKAHFLIARAAFHAIKADKSTNGKKVTAKEYAVLHPSNQGEFEPPITDLDMDDIIVDPFGTV